MNLGSIIFQGNDEDWLIAAQIVSGQKELFRLFIKRYERAVYRMGLSFFHNREDAADFVQEVFLKVYQNLPNFGGRARFSTWLYKIAYNTAINKVVRKKEYQSLIEDELVCDSFTPERKFLLGIARDAILEAIKELPEKFRLCVDLSFFYDCSYQEIEFITGFPVNTIKSHVFRAKKLLREKLSAYAGLDLERGI